MAFPSLQHSKVPVLSDADMGQSWELEGKMQNTERKVEERGSGLFRFPYQLIILEYSDQIKMLRRLIFR